MGRESTSSCPAMCNERGLLKTVGSAAHTLASDGAHGGIPPTVVGTFTKAAMTMATTCTRRTALQVIAGSLARLIRKDGIITTAAAKATTIAGIATEPSDFSEPWHKARHRPAFDYC